MPILARRLPATGRRYQHPTWQAIGAWKAHAVGSAGCRRPDASARGKTSATAWSRVGLPMAQARSSGDPVQLIRDRAGRPKHASGTEVAAREFHASADRGSCERCAAPGCRLDCSRLLARFRAPRPRSYECSRAARDRDTNRRTRVPEGNHRTVRSLRAARPRLPRRPLTGLLGRITPPRGCRVRRPRPVALFVLTLAERERQEETARAPSGWPARELCMRRARACRRRARYAR